RVYATTPDAATSISSPQRSALLRGPAKPDLSTEDVDVAHPLAVMFGNEHDGLSPAALAACDATFAVPMFGFSESFNLSVTVGLAMSRLAARRRAFISAPGDLAAERRARLRARSFALR